MNLSRRAGALFAVGCLAATASAQVTARISTDSSGAEANGGSLPGGISHDGRYVVFESFADNLVPGDTNQTTDVFVHDRKTGVTRRVSVSSGGVEGNGFSASPSISGDGRSVSFYSEADNLVAGDANTWSDVFVHHLDTGVTTRVSVSTAGAEGNSPSSGRSSLSYDGTLCAFGSAASNLVAGDANNATDVFLHDLTAAATTRASLDGAGMEGDQSSQSPSLAAYGSHLVFWSSATNLVPGDTNGTDDVFVKDLATGAVERANVSTSGVEANDFSGPGVVSADGNIVAFASRADNLIAGDRNDQWDVFARNRSLGTTVLVSVAGGVQSNGFSSNPAVSPEGAYVTFASTATNLSRKDTNGVADVFLHELAIGLTRLASLGSFDILSNDDSFCSFCSWGARQIVFESLATNLAPGDTNHQRDVFVRGPLLTLDVTDDNPAEGDRITFTTWKGIPNRLHLLMTTEVSGIPYFLLLNVSLFPPDGIVDVKLRIPQGVSGLDFTCLATTPYFKMGELSNTVKVVIQ